MSFERVSLDKVSRGNSIHHTPDFTLYLCITGWEDRAGYCYYEHKTLGQEVCGGFQFDKNKKLSQRTTTVPDQILETLRENGFTVPDDFNQNDESYLQEHREMYNA